MSYVLAITNLIFGPLDELPDDVIDQLPEDTVERLRDGSLDKIPEDVVEKLPDSVQDKIPESLVDFASSNPGFTAFLAVLGVLALVGVGWGIVKSTIKVAVVSAVIAAVAWFFFFQQ